MQKKATRAPSGHLSRLKPVELDLLDEYGLPSKGEKRLLVPKNQELYYARIADRYLAFCTEAGDRDGLQKQFARLESFSTRPSHSSTPPPTPCPDKRADLPQLLSALRKLREGIVASKRRDDFAVQVYLFAIRLGILASANEAYYPALLYLLRAIHPSHNLTSVELNEVVGYMILDAACRRGDLAEAYTLRNRYRLQDAKVDAVLRALAQDNWVVWRKVRLSVDGYRAKILDFAEPNLRMHVLKAFGRSYLSVSQDYLEIQTMASWADLQVKNDVGWEHDAGRIVIRKIRGRS